MNKSDLGGILLDFFSPYLFLLLAFFLPNKLNGKTLDKLDNVISLVQN